MYDTRYIHHEIYAYEYIDIDIDQADWVGGGGVILRRYIWVPIVEVNQFLDRLITIFDILVTRQL